MQASPLPYHHFYHNPYHPAIQGPQDHELKKQYLSLLPPQQIIDICLNFDLHVPHYVKSTVWPADFNAAIAAMRNKASPSSEPSTNEPSKPDVSNNSTNDSVPPPSSSTDSAPKDSQSSGSNAVNGTQESTEKQPDPQPPDKPSTSSPGPPTPITQTPAAAPPSTSTPQSQPSTSHTQPEQPQVPSQQPQQPPYPHQPYGYPQAAYPHAPYYQHASGYPYPYPQWPGYPPHPHMPGPAGYPQQQPAQPADPFNINNLTALNNQGLGSGVPADDLPSYEEMIAEALTGCTDPEGCAPKDLFTWMAARYPLQQNFRPSASQALQKAFKRGRLEKSSGGKYRLNATWEGGTTSRRTTRRPQTQNQASQPTNTIPSSPFTHAPLVHHHQQNQQNATQQNPGHPQYPYGYPYPGYPGYPQQGQQPNPQTGAKTTVSSATPTNGAPAINGGQSDDPYEAAQNILKAINFGGLLKLPPENDAKAPSEAPGNDPSSPPLNGVISPVMKNIASSTSRGVGATANREPPQAEGAGMHPRAELQAQLVLLAAQLAELAQEDGEGPTVITAPDLPPLPMTQPPPPPSMVPLAQVPGPASAVPPAPGPVIPQILSDPPSVPTPVHHPHPHAPQISALTSTAAVAQEEEDSGEDGDDDMEEVI